MERRAGAVAGAGQSGGAGGAAANRLALAIFAVGALLLLVVIHADLRPPPVYASQEPSRRAASVLVMQGHGIEVALRPGRALSAVYVPVWTEARRAPLELSLLRVAPGTEPEAGASWQGEILTRVEVRESGLVRLPLPDGAERLAPGERIVLQLRSSADRRPRAPRVLWAGAPPRGEVEVRVGGLPLSSRQVGPGAAPIPETGPLLLLEHPWPTRGLAWLWLLPAGLGLAAWRRPALSRWLLVSVALAATVTSSLLWQRDYVRREVHVDADRYAESATQMARFVTEPASRGEVRDWFRAYPHATTQAVPALIAPAVALGVPVALAYAFAMALAAYLSLIVFQRILRAGLGVDARVAWVATVAFGCHLVVLRSFARPVTDAAGLLVVLLTLWLLVRRIRSQAGDEDWLLALAVLAHPLLRPQGFAYWPFIAAAIVAIDSHKAGGALPLAGVVGRCLRVFAPPALVIAALYVQFDWMHNVDLMLRKASRFRINATLPIFLQALLGSVQWLPALWWPARRRLRDPAVALVASWGLYALALLVVVRAPFWMRHFLPCLPAVHALAAVGLMQLAGPRRRDLTLLLGATAALNVAVTLWLVHTPGALPEPLAGFVSTP